jgi:PBP1b-binding outer membrane lipoprotein LpoB
MTIALVGCGQLVSEKLTVSRAVPSEACPITKKLVILPLADYSSAEDTYMATIRHNIIVENIIDQLVSKGYQMPPQEDLLKYLVDQDIIKIENGMSSQLEKDIQTGGWSDDMKSELTKLASTNNGDKSKKVANALDNKTLGQIAKAFDAKYVMRGRIIKFETSEDTTWNPIRKGLIPVIVGGTDRSLFGFANSENYDMLDQMVIGGTFGVVGNRTYANSINARPSVGKFKATAVGAGVGLLASQSGNTDAATVQLRLWVQSAETGEIVWTNRAEVKVKPESVFADNDPAKLYEIAVNTATRSLISDFANKTAALQ